MDTCVCCGAYVPEGRMVCLDCERAADGQLAQKEEGKGKGQKSVPCCQTDPWCAEGDLQNAR